jgi:PmbA protein
VAITGEGTAMERDWCGESRAHLCDLPSPDYVGHLAAERALARAGAKKPRTGAFPVLFDERVAGQLVGHLLGAISGTAIARGASWLMGAMDEPVLSRGLSLLEDPTRPRIAGSRPFDGEGLPAVPRPIVEDGVLKRWLLDLATARKLGLASTANAYRGTSAPPAPGAGNVSLTQGDMSRDELIAEMGTGLLVTSMIGATISPTTGDYSRGASGFWVENGAIAYPVNECTVAGNLREFLQRIVPANDARPELSRVVPSLLVEGLTIAGE